MKKTCDAQELHERENAVIDIEELEQIEGSEDADESSSTKNSDIEQSKEEYYDADDELGDSES